MIKNKQKKLRKYSIALAMLLGVVLLGNLFVPFKVAKAETVITACDTKGTNKGERSGVFVFTISGSSVSSDPNTDTVEVTPTVECCCTFNDFPTGEIPQGSKLTQCPSQCQTLERRATDVDRSQFAPKPKTSDLKPDTSSQFYPLTGVSDIISKWYAAMFYLAVVLAIIQIFRGGIEYAIAAGNSSKTEEAKGIIVEAVIGLGVALLAAGILVFLRGPGVFTFNP